MEHKNSIVNISGGQINIARDRAIINARQNNGIHKSELDSIIQGIMKELPNLRKEEADKITDIVEMAEEELGKPEPRVSRLRNCLSLIAPMVTVANGVPTLMDNLQRLKEFICMQMG